MQQSVRDAFLGFNAPFEGRVAWMYVDVKGLVTVGVGNLIDPVALALALPFQHEGDGSAATADEITTAWTDLKDNKDSLAVAGFTACRNRNDLRLTDADIDSLVDSKLTSNETTVTHFFPDFDTWPADAQLAVLSMAWALGPAFSPQWPNLTAALKAQDFGAAADNCRISEAGNPGVAPRNVADAALFRNAADVVAKGADPAVVYYPGSVPDVAAVPPQIFGLDPTTGSSAGGTTVTVSGAGFTDVFDISFGPTSAAEMVVDSDTQITAVTPPGEGDAEVLLTTPGSASTPDENSVFRYVDED